MATGFLAALGAKHPDTTVLFDDTFDDGFCGWESLMSGSTAKPPPTLVEYPSQHGSQSMKICTGPKRSSTTAGSANAIKRLSRIWETGIIYYEVWWAWGSEDLTDNPALISCAIDTQHWDNSSRAFPTWRWQRFDNGDQSVKKQWSLISDAAAAVYVPGNGVKDYGSNEQKRNVNYTKVSFNLGANSGVGAYDRLWPDANPANAGIDVSGLGAGRGAQTPQTDLTTTSFAGGMNFLVNVTNRNNADYGKAWLVIDRIRAYWSAT